MKSLWKETVKIPEFKALSGDIKTDVLIIGGGLSGVLTAFLLEQSGIDYLLVEAERIGMGITANTTAKITSSHGLIYDKMIKKYGIDNASLYLKANESALEKYREICRDIDCDFKNESSFVYSLNDRIKLENEVKALNKIGFNAEFCEDTPLPIDIKGAVKYPNQASFNPLKFIASISKDLNIKEQTKVIELIGTTAITNCGKIEAQKIIVATHFPLINKHGGYFIKMYQHRSYTIALKNAQNIDGMYVDEALNGMSFRNYKDLLLIGGGDHRTGKKGGTYNELRKFAKKHYPNAEEKFYFATQDCMTLDGIPYIGEYSANTKNLYVATGFNKWGMTSSMVAAGLLCDLISEKATPYKALFSPSRSIFTPQLPINILEAVSGIIYPTTKRCPHLGCALKWNKYEHSWDCPCHGSRFTQNGKLIDNPATGDLKNKPHMQYH